MRITAKIIAEQLNVSTATVDRVLNNRKGVSEKTIQRVKKKAQELGYKPNKAAKFLSTQKVMKAAFVLPFYPDYFWSEIENETKVAVQIYEEVGFDIDIYRFKHSSAQLNYFKEIVEEKTYDAIVLAPDYAYPMVNTINAAIGKGIPVFTLSNDVTKSKRISFVGSNYVDSGYLAGELISIFAKDLTNTVLIKEKKESNQMADKENGFRNYLKKNKIDTKVLEVPVYTRNVKAELNKHKNIFLNADAVYVANGVLGKTAEFLYRNQWLKEETALIGHDIDSTIYNLLCKGVIKATICQDPRAQAYITVKKVFEYLFSDDKSQQQSLENDIMKLEIVTKSNAKYYVKNA